MHKYLILFLFIGTMQCPAQNLPQTGISGLYEVVQAVEDVAYAFQYWKQYGFTVVDSVRLTAAQAQALYGVPSALISYRLQNGNIDSHGLLRLWKWEKATGPGVGYTEPETIGSRMAVMKTADIMRIYDVYAFLRERKQPWLPTLPITDDLFGLNSGEKNFINRPVLVRENAVYGAYFNHVFFQRYGYEIPGYGTINPDAPLRTSEFTHHDFILPGKDLQAVQYVSEVLGFQSEGAPAVNGDWQKGPQRVFMMRDGYTHLYQGFVSPNNICGKLKFFVPLAPKPDRSAFQQPGQLGITLHSLYAPDIATIRSAAERYPGLSVSAITENEWQEKSFLLKDSAGITWQIIQKSGTRHLPEKKLQFVFTQN